MADLLEWIYNSRSGFLVEMPSPAAYLELKSGLGWHGPFKSKDDALAYYNKNKSTNPGWQAPSTSIGDAIGNSGKALNDSGEAVVKGVGLGGLTNEAITSWFIRIGEVLLGIVLLGVGVAKLTGTTNAVAKFVKAKI